MKLDNLRSILVYPMTVRQLAVVLAIHETSHKFKLRELAVFLRASRPSITRSYDALCRFGLLRRERCDKDHRDVYGLLTDKGKKLAKEISL